MDRGQHVETGNAGDSTTGDKQPIGGFSHVIGPTTEPLLDLTIPEMLKRTVATYPKSDAVIFSEYGSPWNYATFDRLIDALAIGLHNLGIKKGDRVGIWAPNRPEWILTQFATARLGAIMVCINPAYRLSELEYVLGKVDCKALITAPSFKSSDYLELLAKLLPELATSEPGGLNSQKLPHLKTVIRMGDEKTPGTYNFDELLNPPSNDDIRTLDAITERLDCHDAINIQFTSGTTGSPKGATLTHHNIVNNANFMGLELAYSEKDRICLPVPLYHAFGMVMGVLAAVPYGAAMLFPSEAFEPKATLQAIHDQRATACYGVPTMFIAMLEELTNLDLDMSSMRTGVMAGAPCPIKTMNALISDMHTSEMAIAYGMTETGPISFMSDRADPLERRVSTVGRIMHHAEVKIIDEAGNITPVDVQGEICTRGYLVMKGYWNDNEKTRDAIDEDGWMHTGDLGVIDAEGYCNISGRVKDMVIRGGENIFPKEIEDFFFKNPKIENVQVFGIPDRKYGEEVCAWIVLKEGETSSDDEIKQYCKDQIAHYKVPRYIRFVHELPMTVTGKPKKFVMRDAMKEELGIVEEETA